MKEKPDYAVWIFLTIAIIILLPLGFAGYLVVTVGLGAAVLAFAWLLHLVLAPFVWMWSLFSPTVPGMWITYLFAKHGWLVVVGGFAVMTVYFTWRQRNENRRIKEAVERDRIANDED